MIDLIQAIVCFISAICMGGTTGYVVHIITDGDLFFRHPRGLIFHFALYAGGIAQIVF